MNRCPQCQEIKALTEFHHNARRKNGYAIYCRNCAAKKKLYYKNRCLQAGVLTYNQRTIRKIRLRVLTHYGGNPPKCECCSENKIEFLSIDHIDGGGTKQRKTLQRRGSSMYRWIIENFYPIEFRVLCHNCNQAIGFYGYCPHKIDGYELKTPYYHSLQMKKERKYKVSEAQKLFWSKQSESDRSILIKQRRWSKENL